MTGRPLLRALLLTGLLAAGLAAPGARAQEAAPADLGDELARVIERASPSVCRVSAGGRPLRPRDLLGEDAGGDLARRLRRAARLLAGRPGERRLGSGCIVHPSGLVLTTSDLLAFREPEVVVALADGSRYRARAVEVSWDRGLALCQLLDAPSDLPALPLATEEARPGRPVVVLGHPFGIQGEPSASLGIVSAVAPLEPGDPGPSGPLIRTGAAINPGAYGGPLVDREGRLVAIGAPLVPSRRRGTVLSVAVPVARARPLLRRVLREAADDTPDGPEAGTPRAYLGVHLRDAGASGPGALVEGVTEGSPADEAGLEAGDRILAVDGEAVSSNGALVARLAEARPGDVLRLLVDRDGWQRTLRVRLGEREDR